MAVVSKYGKPDLFITMTGNSKWEKCEKMYGHRKIDDCVHIQNRVFKSKKLALLHDIIHKYVLGKPKGYIWVIEYQNRGMPHCHFCVILDPVDKPKNGESLDSMIWAEVPICIEMEKIALLQKKRKELKHTLKIIKNYMYDQELTRSDFSWELSNSENENAENFKNLINCPEISKNQLNLKKMKSY